MSPLFVVAALSVAMLWGIPLACTYPDIQTVCCGPEWYQDGVIRSAKEAYLGNATIGAV
jgi:hypothetical protein